MRTPARNHFLLLLFPALIIMSYSCRNKPEQIAITTTDISGLKQAGAIAGGTVSTGKKTEITAKGVCWDMGAEPKISNKHTIDGSGSGNFISTVTGLRPGTTYNLRAYAITSTDTVYGNTISFATLNYGNVTDIEGNEYKTITIGDQIWMAKNLRVTKYRDGTPIRLVTDSTAWSAMSSPGFCWYNNDESTFKTEYGALYNWYTIKDGKLCPQGWHVPSIDEWSLLAAYSGGDKIAGGNLKESGTSHWVRPNSGAKDISRFTALPGGLRYSNGIFHDLGFGAYWWSSTEYNESRGIFTFLYYQDSIMYRFDNEKKLGFSVRCLKD